jgi:hypothetical protein
MCLGAKPVKAAPAPVVQPAPTRDTVQSAAVDERKRARSQSGVYGSIFTSVLGDPNYNKSVQAPAAVAALG